MSLLHSPLVIGRTTIRNRLYRAPVLEGAGDGDDAAEVYEDQFVGNARHGVGLIIQGSSCILPEGRTSPGMTCVDTRQKMLRLEPMVRAVHQEGASIFIQLGHGGLFAMEAWHEPYASSRRGPILAASPVPWLLRPVFRGVPVHVMTTDEVHDMCARYGEVAAWAREAGYDGVQLGSANAKLLDQFLSPFYNRRTDEFGGSLERRASVLHRIRREVSARAGIDFPCSVKVPVERTPPGFHGSTVEDAMRLCRLAEEWGYDAVTPVEVSVLPDTTLSRGGTPDSFWTNTGMRKRLERAAPSRSRQVMIKAGAWWGGRQAPFDPVWNRHLFQAASSEVSIPVFAVGGIRSADEVRKILDGGEAAMVGIGRPFYAEPDLAARILADRPGTGLCLNSNRCVPAQMLGMRGACYNPEVNKRAKAGNRS
ncbi:MAG TPA: NADH:flavin oxidoreductase [Acidimicrobiales bacterium]|nr:NADH:flavin oxidoreductase [Acidimicrobiales bacterium]